MTSSAPGAPVRLIIETDFFSDVDDVGALAIAHYYAGLGQAEIEAIGVNTPSRFGVPAVRKVNDFYSRGSIPIGAFASTDDSRAEKDYASVLARSSPQSSEEQESAVRVLRRTLAQAQPASITVASIGFLTNLADLLVSGPDDLSRLAGTELVERAVHRTVVMGGRFPEGVEFNFAEDIPSAQAFLEQWPRPAEFLGWESGADVITGTRLTTASDPADNPVALAYELYSGRGNGRYSWDLQTVDIAVRGPGSRYSASPPGVVHLAADGTSTFRASDRGRHVVYSPAKPSSALAAELDTFLDRSWAARR